MARFRISRLSCDISYDYLALDRCVPSCPLANRVLVALLDLERLARQPRPAETRRQFWLRGPFGRGGPQPAERCADCGRAEQPSHRFPLLVVQEAGGPEQQRVGEPKGGPAREPADAG